MTKTFESECWKCEQAGRDVEDARITTRDGGGTWRHDKAPASKHTAAAHGTMRQI